MTQTPFRRRLPDGVLDYLVQSKPGWWQDLLEARYLDDNNVKQPLFIAIRDGYFNAYVEGQSVLKVSVDARRSKTIRLNAKIHRKYVLGRDAGDGYFSFDGENVFDKSTREVIEHYKGAETLERWILAASNYSKGEKKGVAAIACNHRNIIDVEMALPANENPKNGKKVAPRMDIVALERVENSKIQIAFYEAKLFRNKALHL
ncbi:MAG: hypothetical protein P1V21_16460 [Rhizobiaceae bacterium]|nr:hypothetical protein [Rhizobiaceae bacterium]